MTFALMLCFCILTTFAFILLCAITIYSYRNNVDSYIQSCIMSIFLFLSCTIGWYNTGYFLGQVDSANNENHVYLHKNSDNSTEWIYTHNTTQPS